MSGQWEDAINIATGAYRGSDNLVHGGLHSFNGARTVLPEGATAPQFEARIARSTWAGMRSGANGNPVFSDGSALNMGDIKRAQWVPVSNNHYALQIGGQYVGVKQHPGAKFIVDWSAIR